MHSSDTITIRTDHGAMSLPRGSTLAQALDLLAPQLGRAPDAVASAVNGTFVARAARNEHVLSDGDTVLCFAPITGG